MSDGDLVRGAVHAVRDVDTGGELDDDVDAGAIFLRLDHTHDFNEGGGRLVIGDDVETILRYVRAADGPRIVELAEALASSYDAGTKVRPYPLVKIRTLHVDVGGGDTVPARLPDPLKVFVPEGTRARDERENVWLEHDHKQLQWLVHRINVRDGRLDGFIRFDVENVGGFLHVTTSGGMIFADSGNGIQISTENDDITLTSEFDVVINTLTGALAVTSGTLGFFGASPAPQQVLARPSGDAGDLWDVMNAYGLVVPP